MIADPLGVLSSSLSLWHRKVLPQKLKYCPLRCIRALCEVSTLAYCTLPSRRCVAAYSPNFGEEMQSIVYINEAENHMLPKMNPGECRHGRFNAAARSSHEPTNIEV